MLAANELHHRLITLMQQPHLIHNLTTNIVSYQQNGVVIPASVNEFQPLNCYVVSPLTQIIYYSRDEIPKVDSALLRAISQLLTRLLEWPLRRADLDRIQILNNQCLSTNFYGDNWQQVSLPALRQQALQRYPHHGLMLRSLNHHQHNHIIMQAQQDDWLPLINRQVYLFDDHHRWRQRNNTKADLRLLRQSDWTFRPLDPANSHQMRQAERLYRQLYLEKYSQHNVAFSADYLAQFSQAGLITLFGLFHHDQLLGVAGFFGVDRTLTVPIVGYDTHQPTKLALYRRIMAFVIEYAMQHQFTLNLSSGAPEFKRLRGGQPIIEYNYVYIHHLNGYSQRIWKSIAWLTQHLYGPILKKFEL